MKVKILKSCTFSLGCIKPISLVKGEILDVVSFDEVRKLERHGVATSNLETILSDKDNLVIPLTDEQVSLMESLEFTEEEFRGLSDEEVSDFTMKAKVEKDEAEAEKAEAENNKSASLKGSKKGGKNK